MSTPAAAEPASQTYKGHCHCGKFAYEFKHPSLDEYKAMTCNCSICSRKAYVHSKFLPVDDITFTSGSREELSKYIWKNGVVHHLFCPVDGCAVGAYVAPQNAMSINLNNVEDIDIAKVDKFMNNGKDS
ncbi:hypothetical protein SISNIDRAFT_465997 [Sistotremastrum niveocremeum HHB9708]|uniref:CENP-V/GFA domain-containing protein n=2 Tax=Sistotremastraceae TaxID=3402574 RepID=A0A164V5U6_9AGAM|nr:hypothetical protein SISNIDRAFT_465997 [Sistotremastrum niveocremeum HHB9708]KZT33367.1 hypothetical protein SISSUDRAFT_1066191 [Sistotremastrum suecicum HHB10207 ss-3]